ncbi:unnamed protein product [Rotaria sp. Silwood2]|nr:unnamed protein product [Rotaria sp. Silwood2]CAF2638597.1 unnamed protein product [Rotaria sp. Silwood2]CAF2897037.1 unnamed protein product [Rotaria sp. Silwood2]CAF3074582.1 unnamed protein product [Rotaria sp. Silwood2]CAF4052191.1 unnamed protein product [Rotaria sp. Silwood2]
MYVVLIDQISTNNTIQQYTLPSFQLNVSVAEYVGVGFGKTTVSSPCQLVSGNSAYTNIYGGTNQTYLVGIQESLSFTS